MDYLLTGSTGLVGRHILFELLEKIILAETDGKIYLVVRPRDNQESRDRIIEILSADDSPEYILQYDIETLLKHIVIIPHHLNCENIPVEFDAIESDGMVVIHSAASTNLMHNETAADDVLVNNNVATKYIIQNISTGALKRFVFISTAYSCGFQRSSVTIPCDFGAIEKDDFRNPYEKNKSEIEEFLIDYCEQNQIDLQILRPSVVSGRLMDKPLYHTTKFDVFYGWAGFFYKMKRLFADKAFRVLVNSEGTLNVVPVDYVAKVICQAIDIEDIKYLNIVNPTPPLHIDLMSKIFEKVGVKQYEFVDDMPEDTSRLEKIYYSNAGKAFNPYVSLDDQVYDCSVLDEHFAGLDRYDVLDEFDNLIDYAIDREFVAS